MQPNIDRYYVGRRVAECSKRIARIRFEVLGILAKPQISNYVEISELLLAPADSVFLELVCLDLILDVPNVNEVTCKRQG